MQGRILKSAQGWLAASPAKVSSRETPPAQATPRSWRAKREPGGESACKPGFVESNHSSGTHVAMSLKQPTRKCVRIPLETPPLAYARAGSPTSLFGLAPGGVCRATECCHRRGALLPHPFTLTVSRGVTHENLGGLLSVALSVGSRPPGVTWHLIRRSPDFPPPLHEARAAIARPTPRAHLTAPRRKSNR